MPAAPPPTSALRGSPREALKCASSTAGSRPNAEAHSGEAKVNIMACDCTLDKEVEEEDEVEEEERFVVG